MIQEIIKIEEIIDDLPEDVQEEINYAIIVFEDGMNTKKILQNEIRNEDLIIESINELNKIDIMKNDENILNNSKSTKGKKLSADQVKMLLDDQFIKITEFINKRLQNISIPTGIPTGIPTDIPVEIESFAPPPPPLPIEIAEPTLEELLRTADNDEDREDIRYRFKIKAEAAEKKRLLEIQKEKNNKENAANRILINSISSAVSGFKFKNSLKGDRNICAQELLSLAETHDLPLTLDQANDVIIKRGLFADGKCKISELIGEIDNKIDIRNRLKVLIDR